MPFLVFPLLVLCPFLANAQLSPKPDPSRSLKIATVQGVSSEENFLKMDGGPHGQLGTKRIQ
ncbi:MAG: hypothetical protein EBY48_04235 [Opitutae bacterium]|nr:hypothetical protein [Opitutae bacterium]